MQTVTDQLNYDSAQKSLYQEYATVDIKAAITAAWAMIAPVWPLKNVIACNPLQGLEHLAFEEACSVAAEHFQQPTIPDAMLEVNRLTIKWCQAFFDDGQATLPMPGRHQGLYRAWQALSVFDSQLHHNNPGHRQWLATLSKDPGSVIVECLARLHVPPAESARFLTLMLTTLAGWAGHLKYRLEWSGDCSWPWPVPLNPADYLAMRLVTACR